MPWILDRWLLPPVEEVDLMARWDISGKADFFLHSKFARQAHRCGFASKVDQMSCIWGTHFVWVFLIPLTRSATISKKGLVDVFREPESLV